MRIGVIGSGTASLDLPSHLRELARADVTAELINPRLSAFAFTPYERLIVDLGYVDAAQQAARAGCDAILLNSFADYGIEAARSAVGIPVIGAGEAAMRAAGAGGRPYAIVTVWPESMGYIYAERRRSLEDRDCVAVRHVSPESELGRLGSEEGVMPQMARGESPVIDRIVAECERAVRETGARAIALGCTCMAPVGPRVAERCSVPVFESSRAGFEAAVMAVRRARGTVAQLQSQQTHWIPEIVSAWQQHGGESGTGSARAAAAGGECPVCISELSDEPPN